MRSWKLNVLEISLEKELTAYCLVETRTKLEELIPAAMVKYIFLQIISKYPFYWLVP